MTNKEELVQKTKVNNAEETVEKIKKLLEKEVGEAEHWNSRAYYMGFYKLYSEVKKIIDA